MLDYYEGLLFLTTNRPEAMDYAIRSRVMFAWNTPTSMKTRANRFGAR